MELVDVTSVCSSLKARTLTLTLTADMAHICVHWFRKGLRLHDNPALMAALRDCKELYPVFILDPQLHNQRVGVNRCRFLIGALKELDRSLRKLNSR